MYTHKHRYVYEFLFSSHKSHISSTTKMTYTLCTDHDGPKSNKNKRLLEQALRCVYGHYPKGVKYVGEKHD